jgi:hypothetical protein
LTKKIVATKDEVRKFGVLFTGVSVVAAAYLYWKGNPAWPWCLLAGLFFLGTGFLAFPVLRPIYVGWMKFAQVLGWINTRILLGVFFYLVLTPIGVVLRLLGKDLLEQNIDRSARTYWIKRRPEPFDPERYERLF